MGATRRDSRLRLGYNPSAADNGSRGAVDGI
jgi:hypothetical protein